MSKKNKTRYAKLIVNPGSGTDSSRGKLLEEATRCLQELGMKIDVAIAKPHEKAKPIARRAVKEGYPLIIAMGGDDTIEAVIRGMANSKARLGIIPTGTANDLAKSLGIPTDLAAACELIASNHVRKLDLGQVRVGRRKKLTFFEVVTIGIGAAVYPDALRASKGHLANIKGALQTVLNHQADPEVKVKMNGDSNVTLKTMLVIVSNVPLIGPNMLIDPHASMEDGLLDISLYPGFSKAELLSYSTQVMNGGVAEDGKIQRYRANKLKIKSSPKQEVMADGVMLGRGKVKIKVLPGALRVIAPEVGTGVEKPPQASGVDLPAPVAPAVAVTASQPNGSRGKELSEPKASA